MTARTVGLVAAILAAVPAVDQITGTATPHDTTPSAQQSQP